MAMVVLAVEYRNDGEDCSGDGGDMDVYTHMHDVFYSF